MTVDGRAILLSAAAVPLLNLRIDGGEHWALPLDNLLVPTVRQDVARWVGSTPAAFTAILGRRWPVGALAIAGHTLRGDARYRLTYGADADLSRVLAHDPPDGGWRMVYGRVKSTRRLPWEAQNAWSGRPTDRDLVGYTRCLLRLPDCAPSARSIQIEIDNQGRPFDLGLLLVASGYRPAWSITFGRMIEPISRSIVDETRGGGRIFDRLPPRRRTTVTWADLTHDEAMELLDLALRLDRHDPMILVPDPAATRHLWREAYPCTFAELPKIQESASGGLWTATVQVEEIIG